MKLDKIKFAKLISFIQSCTNRPFEGNEICHIDYLIDLPDPIPNSTTFIEVEKVNELLDCLRDTSAPGGIIPAIKAYRALTNVGLLEAKHAVEKYRK